MRTNTLKAPGATLYYEVRGEGPVLLLICGGVYDAAGYAGLAGRLAERYTVVTYDRRGNGRSPLDGAPEHQSVEVHGDDAGRVLTAVGVTAERPAHVFGNSSGAEIGLELATRHPELVRTLVAHEPPVFDLLPDRDHWRAVVDQVEKVFTEEGVEAAGQALSSAMSMGGGEPSEENGADGANGANGAQRGDGGGADGPEGASGGQAAGEGDAAATHGPEGGMDAGMAEMMERMGRNFAFFIGYEVPGFSRYAVDVAALRASGVRVVPAVGEASQGEPPYRATIALAEILGTEPVAFPGDHGGFGSQHVAFATRLDQVLSAS
ncbi:alpha/beta fold hydrolase [Sphaerisporangium sp. NPDC005289]|uniref:alpha/beta fold hydrolase n=1 Tax=Sphaerisporangium sp. NPDC005289 TaxID=3155247 RepID=UPI0033BA88AB